MFFVSMFNLVLIIELDFTFSFINLIWFDFLILIWVFIFPNLIVTIQILLQIFSSLSNCRQILAAWKKVKNKTGIMHDEKSRDVDKSYKIYCGKISICNLSVNIRLIKLCLPPIRVQASFRTVIRGGYNQRKYKINK